MKKSVKYYRNKADKLLQEYYRSQNLKCEHCGQPAQLMHHYFPKSRASALRYNENNLIPLCQGCHFAHHNGDPQIHAKVIEKRGMDWHNNLLKEKNKIIKPSIKYYQEIYASYNRDIL